MQTVAPKSIDTIVGLGVQFYGISKEILESTRRTEPLVRIRFSIMGACRAEGYSLCSIGNAFNRDHGTVLHALRRLNEDSMGALWESHLAFSEMVRMRSPKPNAKPVDLLEIIRKLECRIAALENLWQSETEHPSSS